MKKFISFISRSIYVGVGCFFLASLAYAQAPTEKNAPSISTLKNTKDEEITAPQPYRAPTPAAPRNTGPLKKKTPGQEMVDKQMLRMTPEERKVIQELYTTTLRPLTLERIDNDMRLLQVNKTCVEQSTGPQALKDCEFDFLQSRREKTEELLSKVEKSKAELDKKYGVAPKPENVHPFFKQ